MLLIATVLIWRHVWFWRSLDAKTFDKSNANYFRNQYRRRMQTSAMIGVVGVAIVAAPWLRSPLVSLLYVAGLVLLVCWILLMALADLLSTRSHLQHMRRSQASHKAELQAEIDRLRELQRTGDENGRSRSQREMDE